MSLQSPQALLSAVQREAELVGPQAMLTENRHMRLREKWCAAMFGFAYSESFAPCQIEIEDKDEQREYDFHLQTNGDRLPFQIAEVITPGRKRSDEYRAHRPSEVAAKYRASTPMSADEAAQELRRSLDKKVKRRYSGAKDLSVLLYVNLDAVSLEWNMAQEALAASAPEFASVWLLAEHAFTCVYGGVLWPPSRGWHAINLPACPLGTGS
jgi:hypothetical protein